MVRTTNFRAQPIFEISISEGINAHRDVPWRPTYHVVRNHRKTMVTIGVIFYLWFLPRRWRILLALQFILTQSRDRGRTLDREHDREESNWEEEDEQIIEQENN